MLLPVCTQGSLSRHSLLLNLCSLQVCVSGREVHISQRRRHSGRQLQARLRRVARRLAALRMHVCTFSLFSNPVYLLIPCNNVLCGLELREDPRHACAIAACSMRSRAASQLSEAAHRLVCATRSTAETIQTQRKAERDQ